MSKCDNVHIDSAAGLPENYHCDCKWCQKFLGVLIREDGTKYSKLERNQYYSEKSGFVKGGHIAKTPLHIARWAVQQFTRPGDWVMDPTMGAGTTAVEALTQGRNVAGVEIEFMPVIQGNVEANNPCNLIPQIMEGDARDVAKIFKNFKPRFDLIVNNPPYSGDVREKKFQRDLKDRKDMAEKYAAYDKTKTGNLAFLKENEEYYDTIAKIYQDCINLSNPGVHLVIGVKDMIRNKEPYMLHRFLCEAVERNCPDMEYIGMALLPHYPTTMFMNTYEKRFPDLVIKVPRYQTINVFRRKS
jgi:DNA modification methylase